MRYADLTLAYTETSGGIRTYIDQKRKYLREQTDDTHLLVIPGESDSVTEGDRQVTWTIASAMIPGCEPYRFFWRPDKLLAALRSLQPDVIELGSYFVSPWAAFRYREEQAAAGKGCVVGGYFHTDLANAYVGSPIRDLMKQNISGWSESLAEVGIKLGDVLTTGASKHFGAIFEKCDRMFAATEAQAASLSTYGIREVSIVPLGTDLEHFHPSKRSEELRSQFDADAETIILLNAGRLDSEKHVHTLLDAFERLDLPDARLVLSGEGPERAALTQRARTMRGVHILGYERNTDALARLYASSDIYVTAGPHETFGLAVVEAQASGLPVVGVRAGALIERVPEEVGYLSPVDDPDAMAANIKRTYKNLPQLRTASRQHVEQKGYSWNQTFKTLLGHYGEMLEDPNHG